MPMWISGSGLTGLPAAESLRVRAPGSRSMEQPVDSSFSPVDLIIMNAKMTGTGTTPASVYFGFVPLSFMTQYIANEATRGSLCSPSPSVVFCPPVCFLLPEEATGQPSVLTRPFQFLRVVSWSESICQPGGTSPSSSWWELSSGGRS